MQRLIRFFLFGLVLFLGLGMILPIIVNLRVKSNRIVCQNHLRSIEQSIGSSTVPGKIPNPLGQDYFPAATIVELERQPNNRLSWMATILGTLDPQKSISGNTKATKRTTPIQELISLIQVNEDWNSNTNQSVAKKRVPFYLCPSGVPEYDPNSFQITEYVALAGLGEESAKLSLLEAGRLAGAFRYDTPTPLAAVTDGLSQTFAFAETNFQNGPWLQGGLSTTRSVASDINLYIGVGAPFGGLHIEGANIGYADGSVRFINSAISPEIFRAQMTIAGGEKQFDSP